MKTFRFFAFCCFAAAAAAAYQESDKWDIVILGGRLLDGTGDRIYAADIGIQDGKIVDLGRLQKDGRRKVDARGYWVTPGFIDMHSRSDSSLLEESQLLNDLSQGVTLVLAGDGSFAEKAGAAKPSAGNTKAAWNKLGEYLEHLERKGLVLNVGGYVGSGQVRANVIGNEERPASPAELQRMKNLVAGSMDDGALGLSSVLNGTRGTYSGKEELTDLARAAKERGGIYSVQLCNMAADPLDGLRECVSIAEASKIAIEIDPLNSATALPHIEELIHAIEAARKKGLDIEACASIYPERTISGSSSPLDQAEEAFVRLMKLPWVNFGSANVANVLAKGKEKPDGQSLAAFPALIGLYARERGILDPSEAVRKTTWMAARRLNLKNRGKIEVGMAADIAIFKPETVSDRSTYEKLGPDFKAVQWVVVNGVVAIENGKYTGSHSGQIIRGSSYHTHRVASQ